MVFQKKVHAYVLANYKHPININYLVKLLKGNLPRLMKHITATNKLKKEWGIYTKISGTEITEDENRIVKNLQELLGLEHKMFVERKSTLD